MIIHFVSRNSLYQLSQAALYLALSLLGEKTSRDFWLTQQSAHEYSECLHNTLAIGSDTYLYDEALKPKSLLRDFPGRFECTSIE